MILLVGVFFNPDPPVVGATSRFKPKEDLGRLFHNTENV